MSLSGAIHQDLTLLTVQMTVPLSYLRRIAPGWVLLAVLAWPRSGVAGDAPAAAARTSSAAQARFEAGVAAYEEGRFREAIARFKEADQLSPSPLLSFNIAKVYDRMADNPSALASYRDYLRRLPTAENGGAVRKRIRELEQALRANGVQQLTVLTAPAGASVLIDNATRGLTPWTGELIPGPHTLALRLEGYREAISEIELPTEHAIDIELSLVTGSDAEEDSSTAPTVGSPESAAVERAAPDVLAPSPSLDGLTRAPRWWTWAMFGGSAAALVGAGSFELMRARLEDQARESQVQIEHQQKFDSMHDRQTVARVFLGVGVVAAIAGGVSLYFDLRDTEAPPADVAFDCTQAGCSLAAKGRF